MTSTLDRPTRPPLDVPPAPAATAASTAAQAVGASLVAVLAPVVLAWVVDSDGRGTWLQAVRLALTLWLLAQHGGLVVDGGHVGLVPLGLTLAPVAACWFGGRRLARVLDPRAEAIAAGATRSAPAWPPATAIAAFVATYCLFVAAATLIADMPGAHPIGLQGVLGGAVIASLAGTLGAAAYRHGGAVSGLIRLVRTLPGPATRWVGPGLAALAVQLAASGVVLAVMLALGRDRVLALHHALGPGRGRRRRPHVRPAAAGAEPRDLDLCRAGRPGFRGGRRHLDRPHCEQARAAAGGARARSAPRGRPAAGRRARPAGRAVRRRRGGGRAAWPGRARPPGRSPCLDVAGAAVLAGAALAALAWLSGGPAGPGLLAVTGPPPLLTGAAFALEAGAGAALVVGGDWSRRMLRGGGSGMRRSRR